MEKLKICKRKCNVYIRYCYVNIRRWEYILFVIQIYYLTSSNDLNNA